MAVPLGCRNSWILRATGTIVLDLSWMGKHSGKLKGERSALLREKEINSLKRH